MANKMLIDATHPEETRVVVLRGNRVEEFDFESAQRKQLRGNIYLAKVTRVEPSLQAAFVDYGGNRHGFLAFSEIHPDYYQIPVADRQALIAEEERAQRDADDEADRRSRRHRRGGRPASRRDRSRRSGPIAADDANENPAAALGGDEHGAAPSSGEFAQPASPSEIEEDDADHALEDIAEAGEASALDPSHGEEAEPHEAAAGGEDDDDDRDDDDDQDDDEHEDSEQEDSEHEESEHEDASPVEAASERAHDDNARDGHGEIAEIASPATAVENGEPIAEAGEARQGNGHEHGDENGDEEEIVESVGGADALEEVPDRAPRFRRQYKIQEVIKRRQVMLVQVVKEERGTKGAALTTYLSLAGRYSVLMPNTARGGGISRKITNSEDRARLKEAAQELEVPEGMGVILRTAGANRTGIEIKRDFEYLLRMWETVRDLTLKSTAPMLVYEEGSLVKRSIRDLYTKDIDEVIVSGAEAYQEAKDFMRMLMPGHAKNVKFYAETQPLLSRYGVESQLDAMFSPVVQLRSGGYIVINQAEALVAIDVNSGRATREHHIEDTALKTNVEAADEIARQLRLRDLAGLIVIDFIDMDEKRNNRSVERKLKECLKHDRARIQVGRISHFGLLEMSRQRIRTGVLESSTEKCPYCGGSGHVRSVSSLALQLLRALEEQLMKSATHNLIARTRADVALYVLNQKRAHLRSLEERFAITVTISADESVRAPQAFVIDRGDQVHTIEAAKEIAQRVQAVTPIPLVEAEIDDAEIAEEDDIEAGPAVEEDATEETAPRRRRRRRRRGGRGGEEAGGEAHLAENEAGDDQAEPVAAEFSEAEDELGGDDDAREDAQDEDGGDFARSSQSEGGGQRRDGDRRRRRGRRGGRRNRQRNGEVGREDSRENHGGENNESYVAAEPAAHELIAPLEPEPELNAAVADLDAAPPRAPAAATPPSPSFTAEEAPAPEPAPAPRRRSTVREPAPISGHGEGAAPVVSPATPAPQATSSAEPASAEPSGEPQPRRTGWWSRRFAGG
jgi:ribonuclease E